MKINNDLAFNILCDLRKKELNPIDRAEFIKDYLIHKGISQRALAKELGIPHSTIQDWVCYSKITKSEYKKLENKGYTKKQIYRIVRDDRMSTDKKILDAVNELELNKLLKEYKNNLTYYVNHVDANHETIDLLKELHNVLNRIQLHIERGNK